MFYRTSDQRDCPKSTLGLSFLPPHKSILFLLWIVILTRNQLFGVLEFLTLERIVGRIDESLGRISGNFLVFQLSAIPTLPGKTISNENIMNRISLKNHHSYLLCIIQSKNIERMMQ